MKLSTFEAVMRALHRSEVRYLVAGGLAVNAHGYLRMSQDIDLVIALDAANIRGAFAALAEEGYRPTVPVTADQFSDARQRERWIKEKGMRVLNFFSDAHLETPIDIFVYEPFDFEVEQQTALSGELLPGVPVKFVSIPSLIRMKEEAGRPKDLDDILHLKEILDGQTDE